MPRVLPFPRKQRTREHVIADLGVNHVERFVFESGFTAERIRYDYGYDLSVQTFDSDGYVEPERVLIQVKAAERLRATTNGRAVAFDIAVTDYNLWITETFPVLLILFEGSTRRAYWLYLQRYFRENPDRQPRKGARWVRVAIPTRQRVNRRAIEWARRWKQQIHEQVTGGASYE